MAQVSLALFWHQHQPYYPDDISGEVLMPWVRLHGTKDYIGMALHIKEVPEFRCTINLVPSLVVQIQRYVDGHTDRHLDVARRPADALDDADARYLLEHFFMANPATLIHPYPRYHELYLKRAHGRESLDAVLKKFTTQDFRDLQIWSNLTWMHELLFVQDKTLKAFRDKGRDWSEDEKNWLLDYQRQVMGRILPLHRELAESGQVELTTTPFYHPILPLLWDKRSARQGMPQCVMPKYTEPYTEDAVEHLRRGVELHKNVFGSAPKGMWPSEGSVSQEIIPAIAAAGIEWIATDEEILSASTNGFVHRTGQGLVNRPEMLYRPWKVEQDGASLQIVFRDHGLSDLIGFDYQRAEAGWAARDLLHKCTEIGRAVKGHLGDRPALVPVILDGENCWEFYPDGGVNFLRTLYQEAARSEHVSSTTIGEYLEKYPATDKIGKLFAGSWISHNFYIWIGHQEDRDAWDALHLTREFLKKAQATGRYAQTIMEQAWREMFIAEGSDWFWWYGDDRGSMQDELFDTLFRRHLQNIYKLLHEPVPSFLHRPIKRLEKRVIHTQPRSFLRVDVNGRKNYFDWLNAGMYQSGTERGTMARVTEGLVKSVYFGFDEKHLYVRLDTAGSALKELSHIDEIRIRFLDPDHSEVRLPVDDGVIGIVSVIREGHTLPLTFTRAVVDDIVELAIPLEELGIVPPRPIQWFVEVFHDRQSVDRAPGEGSIETTVPTADFEQRVMWQA